VIDCELFSPGQQPALVRSAPERQRAPCITPHTEEGLYRGSFINRSDTRTTPYQHISRQFLSLVDAAGCSGQARRATAPARYPRAAPRGAPVLSVPVHR
jgi:hypothetical protein